MITRAKINQKIQEMINGNNSTSFKEGWVQALNWVKMQMVKK
jgi:hypothetical protein